MDTAVGLVEAYLRLNGYFTITEYPVVELLDPAGYRSATDLDILAFRFLGVRPGQVAAARGPRPPPENTFEPDPALGCPAERSDMIIGEVKEGRAELNRGASRTEVLQAVLARFGCCSAGDTDVAEALRREGRALTRVGHEVRLVAFGAEALPHARFHTVALGHVVEYMESYLARKWPVLRHAQFKDPVMGSLALRYKLRGEASPGQAR